MAEPGDAQAGFRQGLEKGGVHARHRHRFGAFRTQQGAVQDTAAGVQVQRSLQHGEGTGAGQAAEQDESEEEGARQQAAG